MPPILQTDRLTLRPLTRNDFDFLRTLHSDPLVMRYLVSGGVTEEQTRTGIERALQVSEENPALGSYIAELRGENTPIGNVIIRRPATREEVEGLEIGYTFASSHWGKRYAGEAARELVRYAFEDLNARQAVALIDPQNEASRTLLVRLAFQESGTVHYVNPATGSVTPSALYLLPRNPGK